MPASETTITVESATERWQDVIGYEGRYQVSSDGRVKSFIAPNGRPRRTPKIIACQPDGHSVRVTLTANYKARSYLLHHLVLIAFVGPCPDGMEGSHKDGNYQNNRLENLCWETHLENERRKAAHGTLMIGNQHSNAKLTVETLTAYRKRYREGDTISKLAREAGITRGTMSLALRGITWKHLPIN